MNKSVLKYGCCISIFCRHHQQGRWQARIGRVAGNKDLYLGTFGKNLLHEAYALVLSLHMSISKSKKFDYLINFFDISLSIGSTSFAGLPLDLLIYHPFYFHLNLLHRIHIHGAIFSSNNHPTL